MGKMDNSTIMFMEQLRETQNELRIKLDKLIKNELDADQEEIYLIMSNFVDSIIFLLDFTYKTKEEIDANFINQIEPIELIEHKELYDFIDIKNKKINKCIMDLFDIKLKTCGDCNFNKICEWIKRYGKNNISDYMGKLDFKNTLEGRMLLAAATILTNSSFIFYGNEIDGTKKEPNEIFEMLNRLCSDIFADGNIIDGPLSYDNKINKLKDRNREIILNFEMDIDHKFTNSEKCLFDEVLNNFIEIERLLKQKFGSMNSYEKAMKRILEELKNDKSGGSMYYAWQSNLACIIQDNSNIDHELSNKIACKFLDRLIGGKNDL